MIAGHLPHSSPYNDRSPSWRQFLTLDYWAFFLLLLFIFYYSLLKSVCLSLILFDLFILCCLLALDKYRCTIPVLLLLLTTYRTTSDLDALQFLIITFLFLFFSLPFSISVFLNRHVLSTAVPASACVWTQSPYHIGYINADFWRSSVTGLLRRDTDTLLRRDTLLRATVLPYAFPNFETAVLVYCRLQFANRSIPLYLAHGISATTSPSTSATVPV